MVPAGIKLGQQDQQALLSSLATKKQTTKFLYENFSKKCYVKVVSY